MKTDRADDSRSRPPTVGAVSAGGVVYRVPADRAGGDPREIVLVGQSRSGRWGLPKGAPSQGETLEQAALREVREETGIEARIVGPLGHIEYWFGGRGVRFHKRVHFFLMAAEGGDIAQHDAEHDLIGWYAIPQALERMTYPNEKDIVVRAREALSRPTTGVD